MGEQFLDASKCQGTVSIKHSETCCEVKLTQMVDARVLGPRRGDTEVEGGVNREASC